PHSDHTSFLVSLPPGAETTVSGPGRARGARPVDSQLRLVAGGQAAHHRRTARRLRGRDRVRAGLSTDVQRVHGVSTARGLAGFAGDLRGGDLARALARDAARNVGHAGLEARPARIEAACATRMDEALDDPVCGTFRSERSARVVRVFL